MVVAEAAPEGVERPIRVLVADDEPSIRQLLAATLALQGYEVTAARDGDEAKRLLEREPFEVVITDYQMPGLNGIDVLRFAKLMNEGCQVVVITGRDGPGIQEKAIAYGAADYIQKPFSLDAITRAMASLPNEAVEREQAATESQAALAEKDEEIEELQAA
ncbi:MAG: response regulator, partial [Chloroflexi bacterium]|nr:response regulator [Chloroflexota bacterium]